MGQEFLRNRCCLMSSRVSFAGFFLWGVIIIPFCWAFLDRYQHGGLALTSAVPFIGGFHGIPHFLAALIEVFEAFPISPSVTKGNSSRQRKLLATVVAVVFFVHSPKKPSQNRNSPGEKDLFFPILVRNGALGTKWTVFFFGRVGTWLWFAKPKSHLFSCDPIGAEVRPEGRPGDLEVDRVSFLRSVRCDIGAIQ